MNKKNGFTLFETAIVMVISALLMVGFLKFYEIMVEKDHLVTTRHRLEAIRRGLDLYAATKERLPCPASPLKPQLLPPAPSQDGKESTDIPDRCAAGADAPEGVAVFTDDERLEQGVREVWTGVVPVGELGLSLDQMRDGWGYNFTYAVSRKLTLPEGLRGNPLPDGDISIVDGEGGNLLDKPDTGRWVIVSHGPSGGGAWTQQGLRKPCPPGTLASPNCQDGGVYVVAPYSRARESFDDNIVIHDDAGPQSRLLEHLSLCYRKHGFYAPKNAGADTDGCAVRVNTWHGACMVPLQIFGHTLLPMTAKQLYPPAIATGLACGCEKGYNALKVGEWDSSMLPPSPGNPLSVSVALYTCIN